MKITKKTLHKTMFVYGKERLSRFMFVKIRITSYTRENLMEGNSNLLQVKKFWDPD